MGKGNGKSDVTNLDLEHELPAAEAGEETTPASAAKAQEPAVASEVDTFKAERDALLDRLARLQAEFDNARKRAAREQREFREFAAADVIKNILPVLDSLERALKTAGSESSDFRSGVEFIYKQFQDALLKMGVQPIPTIGQPFDPRVHEAIEIVDTTGAPDHSVIEEFQRGFKYKDRLLRPAMVRVARNTSG